MKKVPSLVTLGLLVLGLAACNNTNDITGINTGNKPASSEAGPEASERVTARTTGPHQVEVMAPNQPAPVPHEPGGPAPTVTPTPIP